MSRVASRLASAAVATVAGVMLAACGAGSPTSSTSAGNAGTNVSQTDAQQAGLNFARCMRSHGVPSFPDPTPNGAGVNLAGLNASSPAFVAAQTACKHLLPVKSVPSVPPSARAFARLLHWAGCMRAHGISGLPDPKPNPPPPPGSAAASRYGTLMGDGGYWVGIPIADDAHSPAFIHLATVCGESPNGHHG